MDLYSERGFENTTVAEIAQRAGLAERTFFRYFADKREVLFGGAGPLQEFLVRRVDDAPASLSPMEVIVAALAETATVVFDDRREFARRRQAVIAANAELRERELIKLASLTAALADALRRRGVGEPAASLAAEAGMAVFKVAFERWTAERGGRTLAEVVRASADELEAVTATRRPTPRR